MTMNIIIGDFIAPEMSAKNMRQKLNCGTAPFLKSQFSYINYFGIKKNLFSLFNIQYALFHKFIFELQF